MRYYQGVDAIITERLELLPITRDLVEAVRPGERDHAESSSARIPGPVARTCAGRARLLVPDRKAAHRSQGLALGCARPRHARQRAHDNLVACRKRRPQRKAGVRRHRRDRVRRRRRRQGHGFATEGTNAVVDWALHQHDVARVQACTFPLAPREPERPREGRHAPSRTPRDGHVGRPPPLRSAASERAVS